MGVAIGKPVAAVSLLCAWRAAGPAAHRAAMGFDVAAEPSRRPLDVVVINFELPPKKENYIHRIGRSGRSAARP